MEYILIGVLFIIGNGRLRLVSTILSHLYLSIVISLVELKMGSFVCWVQRHPFVFGLICETFHPFIKNK